MYDPRGTISGERELSARSCGQQSHLVISSGVEKSLTISENVESLVNANSDPTMAGHFGRHDRVMPSGRLAIPASAGCQPAVVRSVPATSLHKSSAH